MTEDWLRLIELLEHAVEDRGVLVDLDETLRRRLLEAAGRLSHPEPQEQRRLRKAFRRRERDDVRSRDEAVLDRAGIRALRRAAVFYPPILPASAPDIGTVSEDLKCYVCKAEYRDVHHFYDQLCPPCAALNWDKRHQSADLSGRVAIVTGARVKIGYFAALKLLRAGARVLVTTRFARDAAQRYQREPDFDAFRSRLEIHALDLRHTPSVEAFCHRVLGSESRLDFILNNACQTVRRPPGFYRHLVDAERDALPAGASELLAPIDGSPVVLAEAGETHLFPVGELDADLQQIDRRDHNSWRLTLGEVPTVELLEVCLVNAIAPFVLDARLKPLMLRVPTRDKHVVNVSAMEGQFYRAWKTDRHPHTNMAKAALNMLTRTSAADYVKDGIHMNSVDTGWITDEDPVHLAARKREEHGFSPPLDAVDGAARICAPIFDGLKTGEHAWGQFFKDYRPTAW